MLTSRGVNVVSGHVRNQLFHNRRVCSHTDTGMILLLVALILAFFPGLTWGVNVHLAWTPPTENTDGTPLTDLAGYRIYYGTSSGNYTEVLDAGTQTTYTVTGLQTGQIYYFAATTYDTSDQESAFSEQIAWSSTPPVAHDDAYTTDEDVDLFTDAAQGVIANDTDMEGDPLRAVLVGGVSHGLLTLNEDGSFAYHPDADYHGDDAFTYYVEDGSAQSDVATVFINVIPVNDEPTAAVLALDTQEDTPLALTLSGEDADGDGLTFTVVEPPQHGTLTGIEPNLTYTADANFNGEDAFTYRAHDETSSSSLSTVTVTVIPVNDPPTAADLEVTTQEDEAVAIALEGSDVDGDPLSFAIVSGPAHGTLSGTAPDLSYQPALDYSGTDQFTYLASDGTADSASATVSLNILFVDDTTPSPPEDLHAQNP